jgi:TPR repeat protein
VLRKSILVLVPALLVLLIATAAAMTPEQAQLIANIAADGDPGAQVLLAGLYLRGDGGYPGDPAKAAYWYERSAAQGNAYAQFMLGELYEAGKGVDRNLKVAADWREKAANRGNSLAQLKLGKMYLSGEGVEKDAGKAAYWLERAAVEGNGEAQFLLGKLQRETAATPESRKRADSLLAKSAAQGYEPAIELLHLIELGEFYLEEAWHRRVPDLRRLAEDGDHEAEYEVGVHYADGSFGSAKDANLALYWLRRAAEGGHVAAMKKLAQIYGEGLYGISRNPVQAKLWDDRARGAVR